MVRSDAPTGKAPAITRAARILDVLALGHSLSLADLTERVNLSKSSVSDLCASLVGTGLVRRFHDGTYGLGSGIVRLAEKVGGQSDRVDLFATRSDASIALEGHTLSLEGLFGTEVLTLNVRMGRHPLVLTPRPGVRSAVLESAAGRAILHGMDVPSLSTELSLYERHQGISARDRQLVLEVAIASGPRVVTGNDSTGVRRLAAAITADSHPRTAVTLHLPAGLSSSSDISGLGEALIEFTSVNQ